MALVLLSKNGVWSFHCENFNEVFNGMLIDILLPMPLSETIRRNGINTPEGT